MTPEKAWTLFSRSGNMKEVFIDLFQLCIREAGPREVSEDELELIAKGVAKHWPDQMYCVGDVPTFVKQGLREAMRLNAIAKLESFWPSEDEINSQLSHLITLEQTFAWFKARVLWGVK